jgi:hypothetical protein
MALVWTTVAPARAETLLMYVNYKQVCCNTYAVRLDSVILGISVMVEDTCDGGDGCYAACYCYYGYCLKLVGLGEEEHYLSVVREDDYGGNLNGERVVMFSETVSLSGTRAVYGRGGEAAACMTPVRAQRPGGGQRLIVNPAGRRVPLGGGRGATPVYRPHQPGAY